MKLATRSLFLTIFLWFWATVIFTATALVITFIFGPGRVPSSWHSTLTDTARYSGMIVVADLERGGVPAAESYIRNFERDTHLSACLFALNGDRLAGDGCETFANMRSRAALMRSSQFEVKYGLVRVAVIVQGRGPHYIFATELPAGPRAAFGMSLSGVALRFFVAVLVSGSICYLLTAHLTAPILRLREAALKLAEGKLGSRASRSTESRGDELGALTRDFNVMADRIEELLFRQRQLIFDVSHELRSPLARLNVALDLAKDGKAGTVPFEHMESDLACLDEMLEKTLTMARLDTTSTEVAMTDVDLTAIVGHIVNDAAFEAQKRNVVVSFVAAAAWHTHGNPELLHSAVENVVRNAVRYTAESTSVEITLQPQENKRVLLQVRDHGNGVPSGDLERIFQAFNRVAAARERKSGGVGLGLAIAERVVRIHGGTIRAENVQPSGLIVSIEIPAVQAV